MYRILYWDQFQNEKKTLLYYTTIADSFKDAIEAFETFMQRSESCIYSINLIN